jgi:hypothetical protein
MAVPELILPYFNRLGIIPLASNGIYEQQFQMHRFVTGWWKDRIAVNDLSWVSYRNDGYILDYVGLASPDAYLARKHRRHDGTWMTEMAERHHVEAAILYDGWFPERPGDWIEVAEMRLSAPSHSPAQDYVTFYAMNGGTAGRMRASLEAFAPELPENVKLTLRSDP